MSVLEAAARLRDEVEAFGPEGKVAYVYNPLRYAWEPHKRYVEKYGQGTRRAIFVGMNPGPWGMAQTGVPFGDVSFVRDWMGIEAPVGKPPIEHPKRIIRGFDNTRKEPSGTRLWGWARDTYGEADRFFSEFFVLNYCPLLFFSEDAKNLTPPDLRKDHTEQLYADCDAHVAAVARSMRPEFLIGVGGFAEKRLREIVERESLDATVGSVLHPSPASPLANKGWAAQAEKQLKDLGVL